MSEEWPSILEQPWVVFGREVCGDLDAALRREWLVANGLGGYASGTLAGVATRSYHGWLVASLAPPVERVVLVGGAEEWVTYLGVRYPLSAYEFKDGTLDPRGFAHLQSFVLEGALPVWTYAFGDALLERRIWMDYGQNTTHIRYRVARASADLRLEVTPLVTYRDFHTPLAGAPWTPTLTPLPHGVSIAAFPGALSFTLLASAGEFSPGGEWYWNFHLREETARGLGDTTDLYAPGVFSVTLAQDATVTLTCSLAGTAPNTSANTLHAAQSRQVSLLEQAQASRAHPVLQQLTLAADYFLVARQGAADASAATPGQTVIAGYHWFNDWGRDTVIALPGLALATGRAAEAAVILRALASYVSEGMLPNNFPDQADAAPGYNTADAALWFVLAIHRYREATGDNRLVSDLLPVVLDIVRWHERGTRYGIGVDAQDGLLRVGVPGVQLTWMDAKVGDLVVTPRIGKPVEINALWYNVLCILATWLDARHSGDGRPYAASAARVRDSFHSRFTRVGLPALADVVDGPQGDDWSLRPNQLFAVSLPYPLLEGDVAVGVVDVVARELLTTYGLRSLAPTDAAYRGRYSGDPMQRDSAYHQGTVWAWLLGPFVEAHYRVYRDAGAALDYLRPFADHLRDAGLGAISEIFDGDPPHTPRGCIAQAWSVAEIVRVWRKVGSSR